MPAFQIYRLPAAVLFTGGVLAPGWKVRFFLTTTTTPTPVYTTSALNVAHTQPVEADSAGVLPVIYLDPAITYKSEVYDENDVLQPDFGADPVNDNVLSSDVISDVLDSLVPTAAEISVGVTIVNGAYDPLDVRRYGNPTDGFYPQSALVAAVDVAFAAKGAAFIAAGVNVKLTAPLDTLTSSVIRIQGEVDCWAANTIDQSDLPTITCDNCAFVGAYVSATETATFEDLCVAKLKNVVLKGINGAKVAGVLQLYGATIDGVHVEGFTQHGFIDIGSTFCDFRASFYDVGEGRAASGSLSSDTFIDGCAVLMTAGGVTSGVVGNVSAARAFTGGYGGSKTWDILYTQTATQTTSFKACIASNQRALILKVRSYSGVWLGYCDAFMPSPHIEVFATGGVSAADGASMGLVTYNSSIRVEDPFITNAGSSVAAIRNLRTTAFTLATDYWGYEVSENAKRAMFRAHIAEFMLGDYRPDSNSYASTPVHDLGTAANPNVIFDSTLKALRVSQGNRFYPLVPLPQFQKGALLTAANVTTSTPPNTDWSEGGATAHGDGGVLYECDVIVIRPSNGDLYHHSTWKMVLTTVSPIAYKIAETNPIAGIAVTNSSGNLNIANTSGVTLNWAVQFRAIGPAVNDPVN